VLNGKDILALGWPAGKVIGLGLQTARDLESRGISRVDVLAELEDIRRDPGGALERGSEGPVAELAREWVSIGAVEASASEEELRAEPLPYHTWGEAGVDDAARLQMETALRLPVAAGGALMADAHVGYGLPIGGVLAVREAVIPWAVGLDIACRLRLSVFELSSHVLGQKDVFKRALEEETFFGAGVRHDGHSSHEILDDPAWGATRFLRGLKDPARVQLGTSGSGNHFVEFGTFSVPEDLEDEKARVLAPLEPGRSYLALLSHSGSRGVGNKIATRYSKIAEERRSGLEGEAKKLAWLPLSSEEGQEYWLSMRLAGRFAAANHAVIHGRLARRLWRPGDRAWDDGRHGLPHARPRRRGLGEQRLPRGRAAYEQDAGFQGARRECLARGLAREGDHTARGRPRRGARRLQGRRRGDGRPGRPGGGRGGVLAQDRTHGRRLEAEPPLAEVGNACRPLARGSMAQGGGWRSGPR
jgi:hypothetical protein